MNGNRNFLSQQYKTTAALPINHNYLPRQFADHDDILAKIREVVVRGDFTLGKEVDTLEDEFAELCNTHHGIAVGSGTDALFLSIKALGLVEDDEVITTPYTFFATVGAIVTAGARPVFVDIADDYNIDVSLIEAAITKRTRAILPVHWSGKPCDMDSIMDIANNFGLPVVEDACHSIKATFKGRPTGGLGTLGCFSFHPLKNLNVWGDGGMITTNSNDLAEKLRLLRNHGLTNRDECKLFGYNSRLDTIQAVVARHLMQKLDHITDSRIANAIWFDEHLRMIPHVKVPDRQKFTRQVFHIYMIRVEQRNALQRYLIDHGVDAKVHYPIPMHLQMAASFLGYKQGDFPVCEEIASSVISLPVHEFITRSEQEKMVSLIQEFYA